MKPQEIEWSRIFFLKKIGENVDKYGMKRLVGKWKLAKKEINLGSCANPNKQIIAVKFDVPEEPPTKLSSFFGDMFK